MDWADSPPALGVRGASVASAAMVVAIMALLWQRFHGFHVPDWEGYQAMYGAGGAWLLKQGRDPVFVWLLQAARGAFGDNGYEAFRGALFAFFTTVAAAIAFLAPPQPRLGPLSAIAVALMLTEPFLLKGLAQIREGLAFVAVLLPVVSMFAFQRRGVVRSGVGAVLAATIHFGAAIFIAVWLTAGAQIALRRKVMTPGFQRLLLVTGAGLGLAIAWRLFQDDSVVSGMLQDYGVNTSAFAVGGLAKYAYWSLNGALVLIIRHQLIFAAGSRQFGFLYASTLGSFMMPLLYTLCTALVFTDFHIPAVTSMVIRLLFTIMELSLIVVMFRGRANLLTVAVTAVMIADRLRLLMPTTT